MGVLGAATLLAGSSVAAADDTTVGPVTAGEETSQSDRDEYLYAEWVWHNDDGTDTWVVVFADNFARNGRSFYAAHGTCATASQDCHTTEEVGGTMPAGALVVDTAGGVATLDLVHGDCTIDSEMRFTADDRRPQPGTLPSGAGPSQGDTGPRIGVHHTGWRHASHFGQLTGSICGWGGTGAPDESYGNTYERQEARRTTFVEVDTTP